MKLGNMAALGDKIATETKPGVAIRSAVILRYLALCDPIHI